jgi:formate C-acetyltransferase
LHGASGRRHNISQLKVLELALNDGFDPRTKKQLGPHTGDVRSFTSIDQVLDAYFKQLEYFVPKLMMFKTISLATEINGRSDERAENGHCSSIPP